MVCDSTSPLGTEPLRYHSDDILTNVTVGDLKHVEVRVWI